MRALFDLKLIIRAKMPHHLMELKSYNLNHKTDAELFMSLFRCMIKELYFMSKMIMKKTLLISTSLLLLSACSSPNSSTMTDAPGIDINQNSGSEASVSVDSSDAESNPPTASSDKASIEGKINVDTPMMNETVQSPLHVSGQAVGFWFFEGSFPVRLVNTGGEEIASGVANSTESWMTEDFIPFTVDLTFSPGTSKTGTLILEKDNPSGLPENAGKLEVPVQF